MSKIKELVEFRMNELALRELEKEEEALKQPELIATSVRIYDETLQMLDVVAEKLDLKRSDIIRHFLDASAREALVALNIDPLEWEGEDKNE